MCPVVLVVQAVVTNGVCKTAATNLAKVETILHYRIKANLLNAHCMVIYYFKDKDSRAKVETVLHQNQSTTNPFELNLIEFNQN